MVPSGVDRDCSGRLAKSGDRSSTSDNARLRDALWHESPACAGLASASVVSGRLVSQLHHFRNPSRSAGLLDLPIWIYPLGNRGFAHH